MARPLLPEPEQVLARGEQPPAVAADVAIAVEDRLIDELVTEVDLSEAVNAAPRVIVIVELDQMVGHVEEDRTESVPPAVDIAAKAMDVERGQPDRRLGLVPQRQHQLAIAQSERVSVSVGELLDLVHRPQAIGGGWFHHGLHGGVGGDSETAGSATNARPPRRSAA